ncbi:MAG TPA: glycerol dehydrogenase [Methanomassiliicoccales archaeon]|nr:glycerol dehydrogenase [Methanomassiliicoccales archaeon]
MIYREVAWRVFAGELNSSDLEIRGEGEKAPSYLITPLGAQINRLFAIGVLTDIDNIGSPEEPMWRARVQDPTQTFFLSSGQYQPEATAVLAIIKPPKFVAVVGKTRTYTPEGGRTYVSIRPEKVRTVDVATRDHWVLETCKATMHRIEAMEEALKMSPATVEGLENLGYPHQLADGVVKALEHYGQPDLRRYRAMVVEALKFLLPDHESNLGVPQTVSDMPEEIEDDGPSAGDVDKEKVVLELVEKLDKTGKGALWDDIVAAADKSNISRDELDEITTSLLDKGMVYEPTLGKMKII